MSGFYADNDDYLASSKYGTPSPRAVIKGVRYLETTGGQVHVIDNEPLDWTAAYGYRRWLVTLQFDTEKFLVAVLSDVARNEAEAAFIARRRAKMNDPRGLLGRLVTVSVTTDTDEARAAGGVDDSEYVRFVQWENRWHESQSLVPA